MPPENFNESSLPQLGLAAEKRDTFTRLLGLLDEGRREGVQVSEKYLYWLAVEDGQAIRFSDLPHMMAKAMHPASDMGYGAARVNLEEELPKAVQRGELVVRNPLDLGHHTFPLGDALKRAVMLPNDLRPFLESRGIELRINPHGSGPEFWTIENAALAIAEQEGWHHGARGTLLDQMVTAANARELTVRDPHTGLHKKSGEVRQYWELLAPEDVNTWLGSQGVKLRWEPRANEGPTFPWPKVMHGHRVWRLRDALAEVARNAGTHADSLFILARKGIADRILLARNLSAGGISVPGDDGLPELIDWFFSEDINSWLDAIKAPFSYRLPTDAEEAEPERTAEYTAKYDKAVETWEQIDRVQADLVRWERVSATSVTELSTKEQKVLELTKKLTELKASVSGDTDGEKATETVLAQSAAFDFGLHATRDQLIEAFGRFTGMNKDWFTNLKDTPALFRARKSPGQGGRGRIMEPFFCPFEVMQWLTSSKFKKGTRSRMSEGKGWELLQQHFPRVYAKYGTADPRD